MRLVLLVLVSLAITACVPHTFVRTMEPTWASIELREGLEGTAAWQEVCDTLGKLFDLEMLHQGSGYLRTGWLYTWTGRVTENYRVRVTVKFSPDWKKCEVKSEAEYGGASGWTMGYDSRLLETVKTDIMGRIGRTTR
jgi:hypothetical protein